MGLLAKLERLERKIPRPRRSAPVATRPAFGLDWMTTFLPHYLTAAPSQLHLDLAADLTGLHLERGTPGADGATEWPESYFDWPGLWFWDWPDDLRVRVAALDPSKGNESKPGDYQAFVWGGVARDGTVYLDAELRREPVTEMVARGLRLYREFGASELTVEVNGTMGLLVPEFRRQCQDTGRLANVVGITHADPKLARIRHTGSYLSRRQVRVRNTPGGRMLVDQWRDVPCGEFDDAADAAATVIGRMESLVNGPRR